MVPMTCVQPDLSSFANIRGKSKTSVWYWSFPYIYKDRGEYTTMTEEQFQKKVVTYENITDEYIMKELEDYEGIQQIEDEVLDDDFSINTDDKTSVDDAPMYDDL